MKRSEAHVSATTSTSSHPCAMHVFRHISKTGGATMRFLFDRQTVLGSGNIPFRTAPKNRSGRVSRRRGVKR